VSPLAVLASSFVAGIFDDFLARDELLYLGPIFTFHLLAAGAGLASLRRYPDLWSTASADLEVMMASLRELSKRWPSAIGALKALQNVVRAPVPGLIVNGEQAAPPPLTWLKPDEALLLEGFAPDLCRLWHPLKNITMAPTPPLPRPVLPSTNTGLGASLAQEANPEMMTAEILGSMKYPAARQSRVATPAGMGQPFGAATPGPQGVNGAGGANGNAGLMEDGLPGYNYGGVGNWLMNDWGPDLLWNEPSLGGG
jgi:hypothetical protein